jgi:hypothetical protein
VELLCGQTSDGNTYYEQYNAPCSVIRTGDCVYVRTDMGRQLIAQVDSIWNDKQYVFPRALYDNLLLEASLFFLSSFHQTARLLLFITTNGTGT